MSRIIVICLIASCKALQCMLFFANQIRLKCFVLAHLLKLVIQRITISMMVHIEPVVNSHNSTYGFLRRMFQSDNNIMVDSSFNIK